MTFTDLNQNLRPPEGYRFVKAEAQGAYLLVGYEQAVHAADTQLALIGYNRVVVYLNDLGREVVRTHEYVHLPPEPSQEPISRRHHFLNGWYLILAGLEEVLKCLKR